MTNRMLEKQCGSLWVVGSQYKTRENPFTIREKLASKFPHLEFSEVYKQNPNLDIFSIAGFSNNPVVSLALTYMPKQLGMVNSGFDESNVLVLTERIANLLDLKPTKLDSQFKNIVDYETESNFRYVYDLAITLKEKTGDSLEKLYAYLAYSNFLMNNGLDMETSGIISKNKFNVNI